MFDKENYIYGRRPVLEAIQAGRVSKLFVARGAHGDVVKEIVDAARDKRVPFHWVEKNKFDSLQDSNHQGVMAMVLPFSYVSLDDVWDIAKEAKASQPSILFLDGITDPQNLGSILRSASFFGVTAVVIPKWRAAAISPAVVRTSAGAAHLVRVCQVANLAQALEQAKKEGFWVVGADMAGDDVKKIDVPRPFVLVMGSEGEGLHSLIQKKCDLIVSIRKALPGAGHGVDSLNVGVATGVILHFFS